MIELDKFEKDWIKLIKGHYADRYPTNASNWINTLKPMHEEVYGWSAKDHYNDFLNCMFGKLLDIFLKIKLDDSGSDQQLKSIFNASFSQGMVRNHRKPIERAIAELCGQIQCTLVVDRNDNRRFELHNL